MAISLSATPAAAVTTSEFVFAILDPIGRNYVFGATTWSGASSSSIGTPALAVPSAAAGAALPAVASVSVVSAGPDANGNLDAGIVTITLTPPAGDTVNASSPQVFHLSPNAIVLTNGTAT